MAILNITTGPSKLDLMLALFDRPNSENKARPTSFTTEDGNLHIVTILSVEAEDGSRESWNIVALIGHKIIDIHYRTDRRTGIYKAS